MRADTDVEVREVGLRDGLQSVSTFFPTTEKIAWIRAEAACGMPEIEVCSFVPPKLIPQFSDSAEVVAAALEIPDLNVAALMPNLKASDNARVVTITSQMGALSLDMPVAYAYCTSKAALNKFMKMAALELGKEGINVCVIHPGWVQTDMGGENAALKPEQSVSGVRSVIESLTPEDSGTFRVYSGGLETW